MIVLNSVFFWVDLASLLIPFKKHSPVVTSLLVLLNRGNDWKIRKGG